MNGPVIPVLRLEASAIAAVTFDTWLRDHAADVLQESGVDTASIRDEDAGPPAAIGRVVHKRCRDAEVVRTLAEYHPEWPGAGAHLRATGTVLLGRELLSQREDFPGGAPTTVNCLNCAEVLTGPHCACCGQRVRQCCAGDLPPVVTVPGDAQGLRAGEGMDSLQGHTAGAWLRVVSGSYRHRVVRGHST